MKQMCSAVLWLVSVSLVVGAREPQLTTELLPQIRTIVGNCRADVRSCPMTFCRYDTRASSKTPLDGVWCQETQTRSVTCSRLGTFPVDFVTSCTCCHNEGTPVSGIVLDPDNRSPLSRVKLKINKNIKRKSGADGKFSAVIPPGTTRVVFHARMTTGDYIATTKVVNIPEGTNEPISVTICMVRIADPIIIDPNIDNFIPLVSNQDDKGVIFIRSGTLVSRKGVYTGQVKASVNYIDTGDESMEGVIPGQFITGRLNKKLQPLVTDGIFALTFKGEKNEPLKLGGAVVRVRKGMRLWKLSGKGMWTVLKENARRTYANGTFDEISVGINPAKWINIEKIPKAQQCYFKARVFDEITYEEIAESSTATFLPEAVGYTTLNQRLQFYPSFTNTPATSCHEVRCPGLSNPDDMLEGLISMKSYERIMIGGENYPVTRLLKPRQFEENDADLLPRLGFVQYKTTTLDQTYINFISDSSGPFYTNLIECETSKIHDASFHFMKSELPSYLPVPYETPLCTARVGLFDEYNFFNKLDELDISLIKVSALSTWEVNGMAYYYTDISVVGCSDIGGEFLYVCVRYRCSTVDASTAVRVDIDIPLVEDGNKTTPAFHCNSSSCVTDDCNQNGHNGVSIDGAFQAPVGIGNGANFFLGSSHNECEYKSATDQFALTLKCYDLSKIQ